MRNGKQPKLCHEVLHHTLFTTTNTLTAALLSSGKTFNPALIVTRNDTQKDDIRTGNLNNTNTDITACGETPHGYAVSRRGHRVHGHDYPVSLGHDFPSLALCKPLEGISLSLQIFATDIENWTGRARFLEQHTIPRLARLRFRRGRMNAREAKTIVMARELLAEVEKVDKAFVESYVVFGRCLGGLVEGLRGLVGCLESLVGEGEGGSGDGGAAKRMEVDIDEMTQVRGEIQGIEALNEEYALLVGISDDSFPTEHDHRQSHQEGGRLSKDTAIKKPAPGLPYWKHYLQITQGISSSFSSSLTAAPHDMSIYQKTLACAADALKWAEECVERCEAGMVSAEEANLEWERWVGKVMRWEEALEDALDREEARFGAKEA